MKLRYTMFTKGNEIKELRFYGKVIQAVYSGVKVIWEAIRSCFGAGFWANDKPWVNDEGWKN